MTKLRAVIHAECVYETDDRNYVGAVTPGEKADIDRDEIDHDPIEFLESGGMDINVTVEVLEP